MCVSEYFARFEELEGMGAFVLCFKDSLQMQVLVWLFSLQWLGNCGTPVCRIIWFSPKYIHQVLFCKYLIFWD